MRVSVSIAIVWSVLFAASLAAAQDVGAAREAVCCGANCCNIGGSCHARGDHNPLNTCQTCNPSTSQTAWTTTPGCTPPDAGHTTPPPPRGGCSCAALAAPHTPWLLAPFGLLFVRRRRR